jgi:hypothetical protein
MMTLLLRSYSALVKFTDHQPNNKYFLVAQVCHFRTTLTIRAWCKKSMISDLETRTAAAVECRRRADWRRCELSADRFRAECHHADDSPLPHRAHDQMENFREV